MENRNEDRTENIIESKIDKLSSNRVQIGNAAILLAMFGLMIGLWNEYEWYEAMAPYGTVISFVALVVAFFAYVDLKEAFKDPVFYMVAAASAFALVNLILVHSGIGAFFTAFDVLMMLYLANKIRFSKKLFYFTAAFVGFFFFYWTVDVKGYFKGYNTNYGGLVLITGFVFAMTGFECFRTYLKTRGKVMGNRIMLGVYAFLFALGYNIIAWYRARCAFLGLIVFAFFVFVPRKVWNIKWLYNFACASMTLGALAFSGLYIWLGGMSEKFTINLFYKKAISGRDQIWRELWGAFLERPITGIGSSYKIQIDWLNGIFEVHSGMLDILFVHGIVVFVAVCALATYRLMQMREKAVASTVGKFTMAGAMAIMASSFLENFFIVPPFLLALLILLMAGNCENGMDLI